MEDRLDKFSLLIQSLITAVHEMQTQIGMINDELNDHRDKFVGIKLSIKSLNKEIELLQGYDD